MEQKTYKLRFWYALKEHIVPIGTADTIIQEVFSDMYPTYSIEYPIWGEKGHMYQLSINFKEMSLRIDIIADDGESLIKSCGEVLDDRFWTIDWDE